jgi:hemolysin activation/secretion protein
MMARFKTAHWMLFAVIVLAPTAGLAQQENAPKGQNPQGQDQPKAAGQTETAQKQPEAAKTEEPKGQTEATQSGTEKDPKSISGMSILGNQEAPKALVIVPWKSSEIGDSIGISTMLDDSRQPVDKEVFMRALRYYEVRSKTTTTQESAPAGNNAAQRRKP